MHFCNWFLPRVPDGVLDPKFTSLTSETWFLLTRFISTRNSINQKQSFEVPLHDQDIGVCEFLCTARMCIPLQVVYQ
jgi:hypothetical protein